VTSEFRIGGGPSGPPIQRPTSPRKGATFVVAAAAAVVLVAVAIAGVAYFLGRSDATAAAPAAAAPPSASSSAFVLPTADLGEEAACKLLWSSVTDAIDQITAFGNDPTGITMDKQVFRTSLGNLEGAKSRIPPDMRPEVEHMAEPMRQIDAIWKGEAPNGDLVLSGFKDGARRVLARCVKYGT
jgi:hypothetical protein